MIGIAADVIVFAVVAKWAWDRKGKLVEKFRIAKKKWRARCKK